MTDIYKYLDYRVYLSEALRVRKKQNYHFSYRFIAQHLGLVSPSFFNWVITGKRKLPEKLIPKIAILFKLDDKECKYLHLMVRYNHSTDPAEREKLLEELSAYVKKLKKHRLKPEQYQLFSKWYYLAIRELLGNYNFRDDFRELAVSLNPKIKTREAREAIEVLESIGLISRDEQGFYRPIETLLTTGDVWESELIANLQIQVIELAKNAVVSVPQKERDISNITLSISRKTMKQIRSEITALRQRIIALSDNDNEADMVYQCNIQLFPVSQKRKR